MGVSPAPYSPAPPLFQHPESPDQLWRHEIIADMEMDQRTRRLGSPVHIGGDFHHAHAIRLHTHGMVCVSSGIVWSLPPSLYIHSLDVHKCLDPVVRQLAPIATGLHVTEWETWIRTHKHIHKTTAGLPLLGCQPFAFSLVLCKYRDTETKDRVFATWIASASSGTAIIAATGPKSASS